MPQRRSPATSKARTDADAAYDRITLHAFMFTLTLATAVTLSYGPAAAMHHIVDVLASAGPPPVDPDLWQGAMAY